MIIEISHQLFEKIIVYKSNAENQKIIQLKRKKSRIYSSFSGAVVALGISDCKICIFCNSSVLRSLATLLTVGLGTPSSSTTLV